MVGEFGSSNKENEVVLSCQELRSHGATACMCSKQEIHHMHVQQTWRFQHMCMYIADLCERE